MCPVCHIANVNSGVHLVTLVQACLLQQMQLHLKLGSNSCMSLGKGGTHINPFSASPPHRTYARSARLILRKLLVLRKIVLLTTNMKKDPYIFFYITNRSRSTHPLALLCLFL
jgi:hypothetical protein